jgi:hypothetical protein
MLVLIGQKKALGIAVHNDRPQRRYSGLLASLRGHGRHRDFINSRVELQPLKRSESWRSSLWLVALNQDRERFQCVGV